MQQSASANAPVDATTMSRLRWRARRGLLENDLILQRYFALVGDALSAEQADALGVLLALDDNVLLDLILQRQPVPADLERPHVVKVLDTLRQL